MAPHAMRVIVRALLLAASLLACWASISVTGIVDSTVGNCMGNCCKGGNGINCDGTHGVVLSDVGGGRLAGPWRLDVLGHQRMSGRIAHWRHGQPGNLRWRVQFECQREAYVRRAYSCGTAGYVNEGHVSVDLGADYAFATGMTAICSGWVPSDMVVVEAGWKPYALTRMAPSPCQTRRQKKAWKKGFMTSPSRSTGVRVPAR